MARRTTESVFPITRTWVRVKGRQAVVAGGYRIQTSDSQYGSSKCYIVKLDGKYVTTESSLGSAKVAVEKHDAGFDTCVLFTNIEGWNK